MQAGETYEHNAYREVEEELGVKGVPLTHLFNFYYEARVFVFVLGLWLVRRRRHPSRHIVSSLIYTNNVQDERLRVFGDAWECIYDGELTLQPVRVSHDASSPLSYAVCEHKNWHSS